MIRPKKSINALVVGHVTADRYETTIVPGGPAFYGARTLLGLGAAVRLHSESGFDARHVFGDPMPRAQGMGVPGARTTVFENTYDEHGALFQLVGDVAEAIAPPRSNESPAEADLLMLAPAIGEIDPESWLEAVRAPVIGLGLQGFVRRPGTSHVGDLRTVDADSEVVHALPLERITALFLSEEDLGDLGDERVLEDLVERAPTVFLTLGARGCRVFFGGVEEDVPAFETRVVDPTGAGDTFAAGTMLALATGSHPVEAARLGACAASIAIEGRGGSALGRMGEAWSRLEKLRCVGR